MAEGQTRNQKPDPVKYTIVKPGDGICTGQLESRRATCAQRPKNPKLSHSELAFGLAKNTLTEMA